MRSGEVSASREVEAFLRGDLDPPGHVHPEPDPHYCCHEPCGKDCTSPMVDPPPGFSAWSKP